MLTVMMFQFLGRNSGRSDGWAVYIAPTSQNVSIPRSEFWSFGRGRIDGPLVHNPWSFNSSVGILVVRTHIPATYCSFVCEFQFLGRNSGRSDEGDVQYVYAHYDVSIPRSEFWSFGPADATGTYSTRTSVSIPRSEFWSFGHAMDVIPLPVIAVFQFLGRNSGRSDVAAGKVIHLEPRVSIPRSEFWSFGRLPAHKSPPPSIQFQFLGRNSGRSDYASRRGSLQS